MEKLEPIHVRRHGSGNGQVVVLHGGPGAPGSVAGLARKLGSGFSVLEPWQRRAGVVPLTVARHIEDLAEVAPPLSAIVGHSWGAMLGLSFAARYRDRVSCLVLVGCGTYDEESRAQFRAKLNERLDEGTRSRIGVLKEQLKSERDPKTRDIIFGELGAVYMGVEAYDLIEEAEILLDTPAADAIGNSETWQDALRLQRDGYEPQSFAGIACPVLMLHGPSDPHPGRMTRDALRRFIPQIEYEEFDRCGHEPWKERHAREAFLGNLEAWLKRTIRGE